MAFCFSCLKEYDDEYDLCPYCGTIKVTKPKEPIHLFPGTILANRYIIGMSVGEGGFGIVYKAWDKKLETVVAVKEFFSSQVASRASGMSELVVNKKKTDEFNYRKERFLAEARYMAKFGSHSSIVNVYNYFEENRTAYLAMELLEGVTLDRYLKDNGEKISEEEIVHIATEIGKALQSLHSEGIIHRDVAPDNIYMCDNGSIKLLDIGSAKLAGAEEDIIDVIAKPGYTPPEQYAGVNAKIGPYTDVYALGATMYRAVVGIKPYESTDRKIDDKVVPPHILDENISENLSNIIMKAMALEEHMRFKNMDEMLKAISGEKKVVSLEKEKKYRKRRRISGIAVALLVISAIGFVGFSSYEKQKKAELLDPAEIEVWYCIESDAERVKGGSDDGKSKEELALNATIDDFQKTFAGVDVVLHGYPESEYYDRLNKAAKNNELPDLFESTNVSKKVLDISEDLTSLTETEQFKSIGLLNDSYENLYPKKKQMPLGFVAPMACVITAGPVAVDYKSTGFKTLSDFGNTNIACDDTQKKLLIDNFGNDSIAKMDKRESFLNAQGNTSAVLITSTDEVKYIKNSLKGYQYSFIAYSAENVKCNFTYEWSIGKGSKSETAAAERLLSWMLGNKYQTNLMLSWCTDGQMPLNETTFKEKCEKDTSYSCLNGSYKTFTMK